MKLTINSRKLEREVEFRMDPASGYIRTWFNNDWRQICKGGGFRGDTITSGPETFELDCRSWYRSFIAD